MAESRAVPCPPEGISATPGPITAHARRPLGVVGVLCTAADAAADWVNTGQALQRLLLSASLSGAATPLHSQPLEFPQLLEFVRTQLCDGAFPQMVLRLGTTSQQAVSVRRPVGDVLL